MLAVPTFHPAFLLRSSGEKKGDAKFKRTVIADLGRALAFTKRKPNWDESAIWQRDASGRQVAIYPTLAEVWQFLTSSPGLEVAIDVETTGEQALNCLLIMIGLARSDGKVLCIPIVRSGGASYWPETERGQLNEILRWFFAHPGISKTFHNGAFDCQVLLAHGWRVAGWDNDTMAAHHVADSELPHGLAYVTSRHLEVPYWKDDVKGDVRWLDLPDDVLRVYNLRDALTTLRVLKPLKAEIAANNLQPLYRDEVALTKEMMQASVRGIAIDFERRDSEAIDERSEVDGRPNRWKGYPLGLGPRLRRLREESLSTLRQIGGADFNPGSVLQLREVLFNKLKFPVKSKTEKGDPSTDKQALTLLTTVYAETEEQLRFLGALARYRKVSKQLSTWVEGLPILSDGRLHVAWRLLPTTGRFSTSPNAQNLPPSILALFKAADGHQFVYVDLSQAELRGVAYLSNDPFLLEAYERGLNLHTMNTTLLFEVRNPGADTNEATEAWLEEACPRLLGKAYKSLEVWPAETWSRIRRLAKVFTFGGNYGASDETLFESIRSERDPETDEVLFPDTELADIQAMSHQRRKIRPALEAWWKTIANETMFRGKYVDPLCGRIQWYRGGFERNEMLARPVQGLVASHMNAGLLRICARLRSEAPGSCIVLHVHDALYVEAPDAEVSAVKRILSEELSKTFSLPGHPTARLPPDKPKVGRHLDDMH